MSITKQLVEYRKHTPFHVLEYIQRNLKPENLTDTVNEIFFDVIYNLGKSNVGEIDTESLNSLIVANAGIKLRQK